MKNEKKCLTWNPAPAFKMTRYLLLLALLFLTFLSATRVQAKVRLNKTELVLEKGKSYQLKVEGTSKKVKWESSNKKVVTVSSKGKIKAKKAGTATITARVGSKKYKCKVTVYEKNAYKAFKLREYILKKGKTSNSSRYLEYAYSDEEESEITYRIYAEKKSEEFTFEYIFTPDTASNSIRLTFYCWLLGDRTGRIDYSRIDLADDTGVKAKADLVFKPGIMLEVTKVSILDTNEEGDIAEEEGDEFDCERYTKTVEEEMVRVVEGFDALLKKHKVGHTMKDMGMLGKIYWNTEPGDEE